ncbi:hypothetical protein M9H77_19317 [Catharanthus roseus]|uniref:Uncharacterized protein n=1 Tax=Catharanthus roseus TaxID=4058 RepID=A0ACC0B9Y8_CATRO|nr:hypothetical protein M9H77_19317 [Catharanthus roseus]
MRALAEKFCRIFWHQSLLRLSTSIYFLYCKMMQLVPKQESKELRACRQSGHILHANYNTSNDQATGGLGKPRMFYSEHWIIDSSATNHICFDFSHFPLLILIFDASVRLPNGIILSVNATAGFKILSKICCGIID